MTDKMNENEHLTRHDLIQNSLVSNKDHISDVAIELLERDVAPHCKF